jgi:hypothetical protein
MNTNTQGTFQAPKTKKKKNKMIQNLFLLQNFVDSSNNDVIELNCQFID